MRDSEADRSRWQAGVAMAGALGILAAFALLRLEGQLRVVIVALALTATIALIVRQRRSPAPVMAVGVFASLADVQSDPDGIVVLKSPVDEVIFVCRARFVHRSQEELSAIVPALVGCATGEWGATSWLMYLRGAVGTEVEGSDPEQLIISDRLAVHRALDDPTVDLRHPLEVWLAGAETDLPSQLAGDDVQQACTRARKRYRRSLRGR